jgi:rRNA maturation RNase YbeY
VSTTNRTKYKFTEVERAIFVKIAKLILGSGYDISLVICGDKLTETLNKKFRKKNAPANVLSFPLDKNSGELFLNPRQASKEAKRFGRSISKHIRGLFIHGCAHLSGLKHGRAMDKLEKKLWKKFL